MNFHRARGIAAGGAAIALLWMLGGCTVGQPAGAGRTLKLIEPVHDAKYLVYLPSDYRATGRPHPLVVTFHGMKPFDTPGAQIREWQNEADRYGYVVLAPVLSVSTFGRPLPLSDPSSLTRDEKATLSAMDEIFRTLNADPGAVLVTSWSYGGYVAHYMFNRSPDRFTCLAVKQSNFNSDLLRDAPAGAGKDRPVAVFYTHNDFKRNRVESQEAALWYARRGYDITFARFDSRGHERTPGPAAAFFARSCGAKPNSPPWELALLQVVDPVTLEDVGPDIKQLRERTEIGALPAGSAGAAASGNPRLTRPVDSTGAERRASSDGQGISTNGPLPLRVQPVTSAERPQRPSEPAPQPHVVTISASPVISITPLTVSFRAFVPAGLRDGCRYAWMLDDQTIGRAASGQATLTVPGEYVLRLLVTDRDGREYTCTKPLTVLERVQPANR